MKLKHHIFRITASIVITIAFCWAVAVTNNNLWLLAEVLAFMGLCYLIIKLDEAHEYPDDFEEPKR